MYKLSMYKLKYGSSCDVLNGLDSSKFSEILNCNTQADKFFTTKSKLLLSIKVSCESRI